MTGFIDQDRFAKVFSAIDEGYGLCEMVVDGQGRALDYRFLEVNRLFESMTGLEGAAGRTALELVPGLERHWVETYARVGLGRETLRFQQGSAVIGRWFDVFATPVEPRGGFVIVFRDITAQREAEIARERALQRSESLLRETNHRVMNSLGMIGSILRVEARAAPDEAARAALGRVGGRIASVGALYRTLGEMGSAASVPADRYLGEIARLVAESIGRPDEVALRCDIAPVELCTAVATPLGLILNELMTNSLKHAFPEGRGGALHVRLRPEGDRVLLEVEDDGQGAPPPAPGDAALAGNQGGSGLGAGQSLVEALARQIGAEMSARSGPRGTAVALLVPPPGST